MARPTAAAVMRHIRSVAGAVEGTASDGDLLRRFAREGDQAAFAALVRRHTGLVLGVCRRALPTVQDAEDASQATFLVLARKANSGRWQPSVANWLFATARKVAHNARVAARRRARREGRAAVPETVEPVDRMTGRELMAALDEELDRLPPRYREPLVLCYLEGLTRDEVAARLRMPVSTVKIRLERGRKKLHGALLGRGLGLGAGLLALAITSPAGASPLRLAEAVLAALSGKPPAAVAALAEEVAVNGLLNKSVLMALVLVGAAVLGIGVESVSLTAAGPQADGKEPEKAAATQGAKAAEVKPAAEKGPTVSGRVLSPDGKPLAGAKLLMIGKGDRPELGTAGADGRFAFPLPKDLDGAYLVARAEGVGIDFIPFGNVDPKTEVELRTVADQPIRGRIVDTEGKPVAGAWVRVDRLSAYAGGSLDQLLADWKNLNTFSGFPAMERCIWGGAGALWSATTDKDGRFEFRGVGVERLATIRFGGTGVTEGEANVATRKGLDPKEYNEAIVKNSREGFRGARPRWHLYGPDFSLVTEREKLIRGRLTDAATGKPRAGVHVLLTRTNNDLLPVVLGAWTDKDGRYEVRGARKASAYMVEVGADTAEGYMPCQGWASDTTGYEPATIDLAMKKGVVITGRIIDKSTGKAVQGWAMVGVPQGNQSVKDYPQFDSSAWFPLQQTDAEGRFRVVAIPGPVLLFGQPTNADFMKYKPPAADPKYPQFFKTFGDHPVYILPGGSMTPLQGRSCKVLEIKPDAKIVEQDIFLEPIDPAPAKKESGESKPKPSSEDDGE